VGYFAIFFFLLFGMPCPAMDSVQKILVECQLFWTGPIHFGGAQIILKASKL
jgi:hypothetical protein